MKTLILLVATILTMTSCEHRFEGKITYKNAYKSKLPNVSDDQITSMLGATQNYFIKGGDYKSETDGTLAQWQLYVNKDNKIYNKLANSETLLWIDAAISTDTVLKAEMNKGVTEILGYQCDELILTCKSGVHQYYFSPKLSVDPAAFTNHKFGNWYEFVSRAKALPLKYVINNAQFTLESTATEVKPMKIEKAMFELPAGVATMESPS